MDGWSSESLSVVVQKESLLTIYTSVGCDALQFWELLQLATPCHCLQPIVPSDLGPADVDVGHGALSRERHQLRRFILLAELFDSLAIGKTEWLGRGQGKGLKLGMHGTVE